MPGIQSSFWSHKDQLNHPAGPGAAWRSEEAFVPRKSLQRLHQRNFCCLTHPMWRRSILADTNSQMKGAQLGTSPTCLSGLTKVLNQLAACSGNECRKVAWPLPCLCQLQFLVPTFSTISAYAACSVHKKWGSCLVQGCLWAA